MEDGWHLLLWLAYAKLWKTREQTLLASKIIQDIQTCFNFCSQGSCSSTGTFSHAQDRVLGAFWTLAIEKLGWLRDSCLSWPCLLLKEFSYLARFHSFYCLHGWKDKTFSWNSTWVRFLSPAIIWVCMHSGKGKARTASQWDLNQCR